LGERTMRTEKGELLRDEWGASWGVRRMGSSRVARSDGRQQGKLHREGPGFCARGAVK
jgi:hypothetical protein